MNVDLDELERLYREARPHLGPLAAQRTGKDGVLLGPVTTHKTVAQYIVAMHAALPDLIQAARRADRFGLWKARAEKAEARVERLETLLQRALLASKAAWDVPRQWQVDAAAELAAGKEGGDE